MKRMFKDYIPLSVRIRLKNILWPLIKRLRKIQYFGLQRYCPVCESWTRSFKTLGIHPRPDTLCPICRSLERHRLVWSFLKLRTNLFDGASKTMLHIAPEYEFEVKLRKFPGLDYLTSDLNNPRAMVKMDITAIEYPDDYFDVIYCIHVLEHVHDDRKTMRELNRVLNIDGWGVFMVPITCKKTFGDSSVTNPS